MPTNLARAVQLACVYAVAILAAALAAMAGLPLPWMIGPLVATALIFLSGVTRVIIPTYTRPFAQGTVAAQVGLYFSPAALSSTIEQVPLLLSISLLTVLVSIVIAILLSRLAGIGMTTALIATLPTSPVEASIVAERYGYEPFAIVMTQIMRICAVVVLIPFLIYFVEGTDGYLVASGDIDTDLIDGLVLGAITLAAGVTFRFLRISNPYFLGPLAATATLSASGFVFPPFPPVVLHAAQIVLGCWLGSIFRPNVFSGARRMVVASITSTILFIVMMVLSGLAIASLTGLSWDTAILGSAPGGVTEMALTASVMQANLPLVTAFHLVRIFVEIPLIPTFILAMHHIEQRLKI